MSDPKVKRVKAKDLRFLQANPNKGSERGQYLLEESFNQAGAGRSILLSDDNTVLAGNHALEVYGQVMPDDDVLIIETDGKTLVAVKRTDIPDAQDKRAKTLIIADNRASDFHDYDTEILNELLQSDQDVIKRFFTDNELDKMLGAGLDEINFDEFTDLSSKDVPDAIWPTDNDYGIPALDLTMQADAVDLPVMLWGAGHGARSKRMPGTWVFYTEDYRFTGLWTDPTPVLNSGCVNAVEPNFSAYGQTPKALVIWRTYQKRWLARYWQSKGIRIFVDMNVNDAHFDLNMLGVPVGWKAYCTRGYSDRVDYIEQQWEIAKKRAGSLSVLFLVYGGGKAVEAAAKRCGWIHVREQDKIAKAQGKVL